MERGKQIGVAASEPTESVVMGHDLFVEPDQNWEVAARRNVLGLVAVGVPLGEALRPYTAKLGVQEAVTFTCDLGNSGLERMQALLEVQKDFEDKGAFGQACLRCGYHPAGVALAGVDYEDAFSAHDSVVASRALVIAFGVDVWLEECLDVDGWLRMDEKHVRKLRMAQPFVVPCNLSFFGSADLIAPWLSEVGGALDLADTFNRSLPNLRTVGGFLKAGGFDLKLPTLAKVGGDLYIDYSRDMDLAALRTVGGLLSADGVRGVKLPLLSVVIGPVNVRGAAAVDFYVPKLTSVAGKPWAGVL